MESVVLSTHDWLGISPHSIVDVSGPDAREEEEEHMSEVVARHKEEADDIGRSLDHAINGVEGNRSPRSKALRLLELVVQGMDVLVEELDLVLRTMCPIDANLNKNDVAQEVQEVHAPTTHFIHVEIGVSQLALDEVLGNDRKSSVNEERGLSQCHRELNDLS